MIKKKTKVGRPRSEETKILSIPVDKISQVEKILDRKIAEDQKPSVRVRVKLSEEKAVRKCLKGK